MELILKNKCQHYNNVDDGWYCWKCLQKDRNVRKELLKQEVEEELTTYGMIQGQSEQSIQNTIKYFKEKVDKLFGEDINENRR